MNDATIRPARQATTTSVSAASRRLLDGGLIDRSRSVYFWFDGRRYAGHPGDTLASALVANGVRLVGRSFKYHRPRGILSAGPEEPNALVELRQGPRREPNTRATTIELYDGLEAVSQNRWPSLRWDLLSVNGLLGPVIAAGFYYKTFMWPAAWWEKVYEPLIRRAAGLGRASGETDPDTYEKAHLHCDVLVVGSGPAGIMAARAAGRAGARVVLCEEDFRLGGRLLLDRLEIDGKPSPGWVADSEAELAAMSEVRILRRTSVVATYDHGVYAAVERVADHLPVPPEHTPRQRLWRIVAKRVVIATGGTERPIVFPGNDKPGVMLAGAARAYVNRYGAIPGQRAVVFAANDDVAKTVDDLAHVGIDVLAVVDPRPEASPVVEAAARRAHARFMPRATIVEAHGRLEVDAVAIAKANGRLERLACDLVCVSGGWSPNIQLACHPGRRPAWNDEHAAFIAADPPTGMALAGVANADFSLASALSVGARIGAEAAEACGFTAQPISLPSTAPEPTASSPLWQVEATRGKAFVDFQNDVTVKDVELAHREGFRSVEHLKRYTTLGMATDQGKTSNVNALAIMAQMTRSTIPETGSTTFRPPSQPVAIGTLAGHHRGHDFRPTRLTPTHHWAKEQDAVFVETGLWLRAQWYPRPGETDWLDSVNREVRAVRSAVGVCDVSTLGKIDVQGAGAAAFLDFLYANTMSTLPVGRARYGLMLREDGFVMDDGTVSRLAPDHFVVTTTTANAAGVLQHMEHAQQWLRPAHGLTLASVSDQWAQLSLAGPRARDVLTRIVDPGRDLSNEAFPHMSVARIRVLGGIEARLFRLSYSGELAYEIAVPASYGEALIRALMEAGREHGITPYGTETLGVLRIEKGHVAGNEINGQTTARDLGLERMLSRKKDFIGRALVERPALLAADRPRLVGLKPVDRTARLRAGSHLVAEGAEPVATNDLGHVTSVAFSPSLDHWIALALLADGAARHGQRIRVWDPVRNGDTLAEVCDPVFVDPTGGRLHV
ncbi:MAG: sarcosine oxidase subunit alpha family protein [Hyphomicrobiaceae bacterium]